jgi:hypothetical protein
MNHPHIVKMNADLRFGELQKVAEAQRLARKVSPKKQTLLNAIGRMIFLPKTRKFEIYAESHVILES